MCFSPSRFFQTALLQASCLADPRSASTCGGLSLNAANFNNTYAVFFFSLLLVSLFLLHWLLNVSLFYQECVGVCFTLSNSRWKLCSLCLLRHIFSQCRQVQVVRSLSSSSSCAFLCLCRAFLLICSHLLIVVSDSHFSQLAAGSSSSVYNIVYNSAGGVVGQIVGNGQARLSFRCVGFIVC